jgi:hypothetical protein
MPEWQRLVPKSAKPPNFDPLRFSPPAKREAALPEASADERHALIAQAAYFRAERRGFAPGHTLEDWLAAEVEVDQRLALARREQQRSEW